MQGNINDGKNKTNKGTFISFPNGPQHGVTFPSESLKRTFTLIFALLLCQKWSQYCVCFYSCSNVLLITIRGRISVFLWRTNNMQFRMDLRRLLFPGHYAKISSIISESSRFISLKRSCKTGLDLGDCLEGKRHTYSVTIYT